MNKVIKSWLFVTAIVAVVSCSREMSEPEQPVAGGKPVTFTAAMAPGTRTALGDPEGNIWPNYWSEGDVISVNGVESAPLTAQEAGGKSAPFTVLGVTAPYEAVYPAGATGIPTQQTYVEGSYDPAAYYMTASSSTTSLAFQPQATLIKFTPTGSSGKSITSVTVNGYKMTSSSGVELGKPWFIAMAPGDYTADGFFVSITDTDGDGMLYAANPKKAYVAGKMYSVSLEYVPEAELKNVYGTVKCAGQGVAGVLVSDGIEIYETDAKGRYAFHSEKKWENVFITIPKGYEVPLVGVQPQFYKPLSGDIDVTEQADFELIESNVTDFRLLVLGDMHLARRTGDLDQFAKVALSIEEMMDTAPGKVYALTLGDHAWDMYWVSNNFNLTDYLNTINDTFGAKGVPFFFTMGNHDNEMEEAGDIDKARTYIHTIAPTYYSFNIGDVHFIVLDDMDFTGVPSGQSHRSEYRKNFTADQLAWLQADLSHVDKSTLIVVSAHEPMAVPDNLGWKEELNGPDADKTMFMSYFDGYNVHMITGHTHSLFNRELSPTFHEHNYGAVCGTWWWSGYLTPGIHIGQEGSPGGMGVFDFDGNTITNQYYQAASQSRNYQFRAYDMNKVKEYVTEDLAGGHPDWTKYYNYIQGFDENVIYLNVWDWDEDWNVEIIENGNPLDVTRVGGAYDPLHIVAFTAPRLKISSTSDSPSFQTRKWNHYFKATASSATSTVTVKVTDRYGNLFQEEMVRPKEFSISDYKNEMVYQKPVPECVATSSSSLTFGWTVGGTPAEDASVPYHLALYKDAACTQLQHSFDVPAESSCWAGKALRFVFGGLDPNTKYYFKVTNLQNWDVSDPVEGTTDAFTIVDPTAVSNAGVGDVILAEDFSEISWGANMLDNAAGFIPAGKPMVPMSGNYTTSEGNFQTYDNTAGRIYGEARVTSDLRLFNWGFFGNSAVYSYAGYLRVGSSSSGARTHIVSPALSGIPDGKLATIDVTVTSSAYNSGSDVAVFINDHSSLTLALAPDQKESTSPAFSGNGGKYTGASLTDGYPLDVDVKSWTTKTVRIEGVTSSDCLIIGSYQNIDTKNRFFLDDVVVTVVSLKTPGEIEDVVEINDFDSFKAFLTSAHTKTVQGNVNTDLTLSSEQLGEIDALYPLADFDGVVKGNNHTITGLTKPLFDNLKGTVSDLTLNSALNITDAENNVGIFAKTAAHASLSSCVSMGSITLASTSEVSGDIALGGMIGSVSGCTLADCHNLATVTNTTTASGTACVGGLIGVADGANTLSGNSTAFNYNKAVILENSESTSVAVGGICGYTFGVPSDFAYAQNHIPDGTDVDDIIIKDHTRNKVYVGCIIGKSAVTSSFDYARNVEADICLQDLTMSETGQVFAGGIIGGWTASGTQTITGCSNSGWIYTKKHADSNKYYDDIGVGETPTPLWSCFGGIAGMGSGTSEGLNGGIATITGKTFTNCTMSGRILLYCKVRCCIGGVIAYTENDPTGCECTGNIRLYKSGGIGTVGDNYHRQIVGGVVGYFSGSSATNLKYEGTILTQSSSPFAYTSGVIGYINTSAIELNNCRVGGSIRAAGSGQGRNAVMCHNNTNTVNVTFTNCVIKNGTVSYATGSKVTINSNSDVTAGQCMGVSDANYTIVGDVLPTVSDSIDDETQRTVKVSIIGDSISTFNGWSDNTKGGAYYPRTDCDVTGVSQTWWHRLIYQHSKTCKFEKNISAGNTTIVQNSTGDPDAYWYGWDFGTRLQQLGIGDPDVVLIHGGTNDYGHTNWYSTSEELINGVAMNVSSFPSSAQNELDILFELADAATTVDAANALDGTTFCAAYIRLIKMIQTRHPGVKIVCVIGDYLRGGQGDAIKLIANHFGEDQVRYADILGENVTIAKFANPHPNAAGMATMAEFIYSKVGSWIDE